MIGDIGEIKGLDVIGCVWVVYISVHKLCNYKAIKVFSSVPLEYTLDTKMPIWNKLVVIVNCVLQVLCKDKHCTMQGYK